MPFSWAHTAAASPCDPCGGGEEDVERICCCKHKETLFILGVKFKETSQLQGEWEGGGEAGAGIKLCGFP